MKPAILILGADGAVGQAVVRAAIEARWPVVAVGQDERAMAQLRQRHPAATLKTLVASLADDASARTLLADLQGLHRPVVGVIAAPGMPAVRGRVLDQSTEQLRNVFDDAVLPQLVAAKNLMPWLAESGRNCGYVLIGGPGGRAPWAGYGHRSVAAAALRMLARVLHGEARAFAVRLQLLEVESPVRTTANEQHASDQWPCVDYIARKALALIAHRNDARCTDAVIDFRSEACRGLPADTANQAETVDSDGAHAFEAGGIPPDVEIGPPQSSQSESGEIREQHDVPPSATHIAATPQEMDSDASLLTARCLQDARRLLAGITSSRRQPPGRGSPDQKPPDRTEHKQTTKPKGTGAK
ncbi:SDR family NAD(P)-dependent oxidoreductase [Lysobacter fragariae]